MFNYKSLEDARLDLFKDFTSVGIYKFCMYSCDYYLELIREFYSNIYIKDNILKSYMNGKDIAIHEGLLAQIFHLNNFGKIISRQEVMCETRRGQPC